MCPLGSSSPSTPHWTQLLEKIARAIRTFTQWGRHYDYKLQCSLCKQFGSTARCCKCSDWFHGFNCGTLRLLKHNNKQICLTCHSAEVEELFKKAAENPRTKTNLEKIQPPEFQQQTTWEGITEEEEVEIHTKEYVPQMGDEVYFFKEIYEQSIQDNKYYYLCNTKHEESESNINLYPWEWDPLIDLMKAGMPMHCIIEEIEYFQPNNHLKWALTNLDKRPDDIGNWSLITLKVRLNPEIDI